MDLSRQQTRWLLLLCLLGAAWLRLSDLTSLPPGLHYDEAANAILASDIGLGGARPVFIASYTGKEVLFFYLAGGVMRLIGASVFALRFTSALVGVLTVAATAWLGRLLFGKRAVAVLAAMIVATTFAMVLFSRLGFRAVTQPLLQAVTLAALLSGMRSGRTRWFLLSGLFLGLTAYTYLAARLFPLVVAVGLLPYLLGRDRSRANWRQVGWLLAIGLLVLAPLLLYFVANPETFWVRIQQVAPADGATLGLGESYLKSLGMLFWQGDPYWRFNIPGAPVFGRISAPFFIGGWLLLLWRQRHWPDVHRAAAWLVLSAPFIMILPTALATEEIVPSNLRAIGIFPLIAYLPAYFAVQVVTWVTTARVGRERLRVGLSVGLLLLFGVSVIGVARQYFDDWGTRSDLFYDSDADLVAVADFLDSRPVRDEQLYVAALHYRHPTVAFLSERYDAIKWLPQGRALVLPPGPALVVYPHNSPAPAWALPLLADGVREDGPLGPDGVPLYTAYALAGPPTLPDGALDANFGDLLTLESAEIANNAITLRWRVTGTTTRGFVPFIHIEDTNGVRWGQVETFSYPAEQWSIGELIVQHEALPSRPGRPPGAYRVIVGVFEQASGERLSRLDDGRYAGSTIVFEDVPLSAELPPATLPTPPIVLNQTAAPGLTLLGYERGGETLFTGESFYLALWWHATAPLPPLTMRLTLTGEDGTTLEWLTQQPVGGTLPFEMWWTPAFVIDHVTPPVAEGTPAGTYTVQMALLQGDETVYAVDFGRITIQATERRFSVPALAQSLDARFVDAVTGDQIALRGYEWRPLDDGRAELLLAWQAETAPVRDYTVFVHLLRPDGTCCAWQQDAMPQQFAYPTTRWLAGEVVLDRYVVESADLPASTYPLEVGLYWAETGDRLLVGAADHVLLRPLTIDGD